MPHPVPSAPRPSPAPTERRHTPAAARSPYLAAVREAWQRAHAAHDADDPALALALAAYARDGRARGVPVATLLRALDIVVCPARGGDARLNFGRARETAGTWLIRSYYQGA
jgi:hypothetical protein